MSYIYNLTDTWNAAGTTFAGIKMAVTNTASGASSKLLDLTVSGATTGSFSVDKAGNAAASGTLTLGAGTVSAPSITTTGDTNTGIYFPAADTIGFATSGAASMTLSAAGRLGIGETSPDSFSAQINVLQSGNSNTWYGRIVTRNTTTDKSAFLGVYNAAPVVAAHNAGLSGWATLYVNTTSGSDGGDVIFGSGNVGIGTASPNAPLCVALATNPVTDNGAGTNTLRVYTTQTQAADVGGAISLGGQGVGGIAVSFGQIAGRKENSTSTDNAGYLQFATLNSGGTMAERMRILSTGNILCLSGGNTSATGTGIAFPATQSASSDVNTLDDYEEGEWTPRVMINSSSTGITYSGRAGRYTKIGNIVQISYGISLSNKGSGSGDVHITDLPFTPYNPSDARNLGTVAFEGVLSSFPTSCMWGLAYDTGLIYSRYQTATDYADLTSADITNTTVFYGTFVYRVA